MEHEYRPVAVSRVQRFCVGIDHEVAARAFGSLYWTRTDDISAEFAFKVDAIPRRILGSGVEWHLVQYKGVFKVSAFHIGLG